MDASISNGLRISPRRTATNFMHARGSHTVVCIDFTITITIMSTAMPDSNWETKVKELRDERKELVLPHEECFALAGARLMEWIQRRDTHDPSIISYPQGGLYATTFRDQFIRIRATLIKACTCEYHQQQRQTCSSPKRDSHDLVAPITLSSCGHVFCMLCIVNVPANFGCLGQTSCPRCWTHFYWADLDRNDGRPIDGKKWHEEGFTEADL